MATLHRLAGPKRPTIWLLLKIELAEIRPLIWRRVLVPETITLPKLHAVIQATMGWMGGHLHEFEIAGERYGTPDPDFDFGQPVRNEQRVRLSTSLTGTRALRYVYDFGDDWVHRVKVERQLPAPPQLQAAWCVEGENACPPEDVGGPPGYADFLEAIADERHPEHHDMLEWVGASFDPTAFDPELINQRLQTIKL